MGTRSSAPRAGHGPTPAHPPTLGGELAARLAWLVVSAVRPTLRWHYDDRSGIFMSRSRQSVIFAIWHNRQLLAPGLHRWLFGHAQPPWRLAAMASASRDGAIAARILELFGARAVRGSSSRRGARALAEMIQLAAEGYDLAVTPDGPRGPRYKVQPGTVALAQYSGLPVIPLSFTFSRKKVLRSWDGFQIPLPFGRCQVIAAEALHVPPDLDDEGREPWILELERRLMAITQD